MTVPEDLPSEVFPPAIQPEEVAAETRLTSCWNRISPRFRSLSTASWAVGIVLFAIVVGSLRQTVPLSMVKTPMCNITSREVLSAIHRAKTSFCKDELEKFGCALQTNSIYPKSLPNLCPAESTGGEEVPVKLDHPPTIRILFVLTVHGRDSRQIRRLLKLIYRKEHYYLIHVDRRSEYLFDELLLLETARYGTFPNVKLLRTRHAPIWGGASLLTTLLDAMRFGLEESGWKDWDYFLNLSESDLPIKTNDELVEFLSRHYGKNFVKSSGLTTEKFFKRQGLEKSFFECENRMWRMGVRTLPSGVTIDGGSDWVALHRDFCQYLQDDAMGELLIGLRKIFNHTLLPAESFFHTVLRNSRFCHTYHNNNLRLTNWKRNKGCSCQHRHIVDWCGCSPNVFRTEDEKKILSYSPKPIFFARKFDPMVDLKIINTVLADLDEYPPGMVLADIPATWNRHWLNLFGGPRGEFPSDAARSLFEGLSQLESDRRLPQAIELLKLDLTPDVIFVHATMSLHGERHLVLTQALPSLLGPEITDDIQEQDFAVSSSHGRDDLVEERLISVKDHFRLHEPLVEGSPASRILNLQVSTNFDEKEEIFRNYAFVHGPDCDPALAYTVSEGPAELLSVVWIDPADVVAGSFELNVTAESHVGLHQPEFRKPLRPGVWSVFLMHRWKPIAHTKFLIVPLLPAPGQLDGIPAAENAGPAGNVYIVHNFTSVARLFPSLRPAAKKAEADRNARKTGQELRGWIRELLADFFIVEDVCLGEACRTTEWTSLYHDDSLVFPENRLGTVTDSSGLGTATAGIGLGTATDSSGLGCDL
ncbi:Xylosyltransferase 2 [Hypsibius exemplaris]|uniref:protein xylosyltransferase n=1 Tax=Hypsibius exemplaris TaxID=2072580 RepID=A0A1W0WU85_HYPEX|nr:Xylosyltransferase 2 [Hypsibius exemplaris]